MTNRFQPLAVVIAMILLGAWACTASASDGTGAPVSQVSKKKSCKKKSAKGAAALAGAQTAKKKRKKCKKPVKQPLSATISSCPTGIISGSNVATIRGTAAVGPGIVTYINFNQLDPSGYLDTLISQEVRVYPNTTGAWSYSFTPGFPESWETTESWEEHVVVSNYRAHDGVRASCSWTVIR